MLFEGWGAQFTPKDWRHHPFQRENNINRVDGDVDGDTYAHEVYTLRVPEINAIQDDYVRKVIDTVGDLDNVLYEIANESGEYSTAWQLHVLRVIREYERRKGIRHPVGMTYQHVGGKNQTLWEGPADWISPKWIVTKWTFRYPLPNGRKVVLSDTDHHCGVCGDEGFVWKTFTRGHNVILMDPLDKSGTRERARRAMGVARGLAERIDLARTRPFLRLSSTRFTLARRGYEYVTYQPVGRPFTVDLRGAPRRLRVEWIHPVSGRIVRAGTVVGGAVRRFEAPFRGQAVLYLAAERR
jgi:Putative collagen-binding domain of a collagenase